MAAERFSAGSVFLQVVPSYDGVMDSIRRQAKQAGKVWDDEFDKNSDPSGAIKEKLEKSTKASGEAGKKAAEEYAGRFRETMKKSIAKTQRELKALKIEVEDDKARAAFDRIDKRLKTIKDVKIGVDLTAAEAFQELLALETQLKALSAAASDIEIKANTESASRDIAALRRDLEVLLPPKVEVEVEIKERNPGRFAREARKRIEAALFALPEVEITADSSDIDREIADIRTNLEGLRDYEIGVDGDIKDFEAKRATVLRQMEALDRKDVEINVRADTAAARGELAALDAQAKRSGDSANNSATSFRALSGVLLTLAVVGPILIPIIGALAGVIGLLATAGVAAAAGIGVMVLGFAGVGDAVGAMGDVAAESEQNAIRARNSARQISQAQQAVGDAERNLGRARTDAAQANQDAARRVAEARKNVSKAEADAARDIAQANRAEADARQSLADAVEDAAERNVAAARRVEDAQRDLADAQADAARRNADAAERVADAEERLADARQDASEQVERALERQREAELRLTRTVDDARDAQEALTRARREAADDLEDLENRLLSGALAEQGAVLALQESLRKLEIARSEGASYNPDELARMENGYLREQQALAELRLRNERLREEQAEAAEKGIEGSDRVVDAQEQIARNLEQQRLAEKAVSDAARDSERQRLDGLERIADAEERLADAQVAQRLATEQGARAIADAQQSLADALAQQQRTQVDGQRSLADAERDVADAVAATAQAHSDGAERIAAAQAGVAEAQRAASQTAAAGARSVEDATRAVARAQDALREATISAGEQGSAAMRKLEESMSKLSPAGQAFATFLFGLRGFFQELRNAAQEGLLPGVQDMLEGLISRYGPGLLKFVGDMAKALGDLFRYFGQVLQGPAFAAFFAAMAQYGPTLTTLFGEVLIHFLEGLAAVFTALMPLAVQFMGAFSDLLQGFADWAASPEGQAAIAGFFEKLIEFLPQVLPLLSALVGALLNLAVALAPYAGLLLTAFTGILEWIAGMDPDTLRAITLAILAVVIAFQIFFATFSLVTSFLAIAAAPVLFAVIGGILAIAAAFVILYLESETFRNIIGAVIDFVRDHFEIFATVVGLILFGVVGALIALWLTSETFRDIVTAVLKAVWEAFEFLGRIVKYVYDGFIRPILEAFWSYVKFMWETFLQPIFKLIWEAFEFLGKVIAATWIYVLQPTLNALWELVKWLWNYILKPIFDAMAFTFGVVADLIKFAFDNVLGPVFQLLGAVISEFFHWVFKPIMDLMVYIWDGLVEGFKAAWEMILRPVLEAIGRAWDEYLASPFETAVDAVGAAWDKLMDLSKAAVRFVVETVVNDGLIKGFNFLANAFGTDTIDPIKLPASMYQSSKSADLAASNSKRKFAAGGFVPGFSATPTADNIPAMLTAGEYVLPVNSVQALRAKFGDQFLELLRRGLPGFAKGGLVEFGRALQLKNFRVSEHPAFGGVRGKHANGSYHYSGQAIDVNYGPGGENAIEKRAIDQIIGMASEYGLRTIWRTAGHFNHAHFDTGGAKGSIIGKLGDIFGGLKDAAGGLISSPLGYLKDKVLGAAGFLKDSFFGKLLLGGAETAAGWAADKINVFDGNDDGRQGLANGGWVGGPPTLYDSGGVIPPGLSTVVNASRRPEALLTSAQWDAVLGGAAGGGEFTGTLYLDDGAFIGQVRGVMDSKARADKQARRGKVG